MTFSIGITLTFFIYSIFWIQLPGFLFCDLLVPRKLSIWSRLLTSYFLGAAFLATCYYLQSWLFPEGNIITAAGPIASIVFLLRDYRKGRPSMFNPEEKFGRVFIAIFVFIYIASFLSFQFKYLGALSGRTTQVFHDYLFHTGNIAALSRSAITYDIRVDGVYYFYHYFYELIFAMCKNIFDIDAFSLYMNGNALASAWPLALALMILGERLRAKSECSKFQYLFYCAGVFVSCVCLLPLNVVGGRFPISWLDNHIFSNGNAMGVSMAITILTIDILVDVWDDKFDACILTLLFILAAGVTGYKGSSGVLLVGIVWAVYIVQSIITKKFQLSRLFYAISITIGFVFTYSLIVTGPNSSGANNRSRQFTPAGTLGSNRVGQLFSKLGIDYMRFPWIVIAVILSIVCILGPCILPFGAFVISRFKRLIKEKTIGDIFDWFAIGSVIMGVLCFCFFKVPGFSQVYFVINNAAFVFYGTVRYYQESDNKWLKKATNAIFGLGVLFLLADLTFYCTEHVNSQKIFAMNPGKQPDLVSRDTMEAYLWIRDNTPKKARIAVDRFSEEQKNDDRKIYFYASAFTERQCFIEGYDYSDIPKSQVESKLLINDMFYSNNWEKVDASIRTNNIDYVVVTKIGHPDCQRNNPRLNPVFKNHDVTVYEYIVDDEPRPMK